MNGITDIITSLTSIKMLDVKELPTQGFFYPKDFTLSIRKASMDDIILYNFNYVKDDLGVILFETKRIIKNNIILGKKYKYEDLKSNDLLYIFFEIVKFTMDKDIMVPFENIFGRTSYVAFSSKNFNYFDYKGLGCNYDEDTREFEKYGYRFSLPSVGVENCLVNYIYDFIEGEYNEQNENCYDFLFFMGNKNYLSNEEMDNLVTIFNEDLNEKEQDKISDIVKLIYQAIGYSLKCGNQIVSLDLKIDFEKLFI